MIQSDHSSWRMPPSLKRRSFLKGCAACAASALCAPLLASKSSMAAAATAAPSGERENLIPQEKTRLRLVFTHVGPEKETWPYQGYDYEWRKKELTATLRAACPDVEFLPATAMNAE